MIYVAGCGIVNEPPPPAEAACAVAQYFAATSDNACLTLSICEWVSSHLDALAGETPEMCKGSLLFQFYADRLIEVPLVGATEPISSRLLTAVCLAMFAHIDSADSLGVLYDGDRRRRHEDALNDAVIVECLLADARSVHESFLCDVDYLSFVKRAIANGFLP
jgi:hypothetical protein